MEFLVLFKSGDSVWLPYSQDIFRMVQFEEFCKITPGLYFLQYSHSVVETRKKLVKKQPITTLQPGETIYVDIRTWVEGWYQTLGLPDMFNTRYVDKWEITGWKKEPLSLFVGRSSFYGQFFILNHVGVLNWGRWRKLEEGMIVLTNCGDVRPLSIASPVVESSGMRIVYDRYKCEVVYGSHAYS